MDVLAILSRVDLLKAIPPTILIALAQEARHTTYEPGSHLACQGEDIGSLQVIVSGRVQIERSHPELTEPVILDELGPAKSSARWKCPTVHSARRPSRPWRRPKYSNLARLQCNARSRAIG